MFSSIRNDPVRLRKEAEMSSYQNRYFLCTPGPGVDVPVPDDVHVRLQAWGGNWATNRMDVENDLRGQTRRNNRDRTVEGGSDYRGSDAAVAPQQAPASFAAATLMSNAAQASRADFRVSQVKLLATCPACCRPTTRCLIRCTRTHK